MREVGCEYLKTAKEGACDDAGCLDGAELLRCCALEQDDADGTMKQFNVLKWGYEVDDDFARCVLNGGKGS